MATRSMIALADGKGYRASYCHFDGYPEGVGDMLETYYTKTEKVTELLAFGAMSCLGKDINSCEFYIHRGEELDTVYSYSFRELKSAATDRGCQYLYVFKPDTQTWRTHKL